VARRREAIPALPARGRQEHEAMQKFVALGTGECHPLRAPLIVFRLDRCSEPDEPLDLTLAIVGLEVEMHTVPWSTSPLAPE
jgi:hypothetical protein